MDDHLQIQQDQEELEKWGHPWGMRLNDKKCYIMIVNSKSHHFYQQNDHILQQVK